MHSVGLLELQRKSTPKEMRYRHHQNAIRKCSVEFICRKRSIPFAIWKFKSAHKQPATQWLNRECETEKRTTNIALNINVWNVFEFETVGSCLKPRMHYNLQKTVYIEHWAQYARYLDVHFAAFLIVVQTQKKNGGKTKKKKTRIVIRISLASYVQRALCELNWVALALKRGTLVRLLNSLLYIRIQNCATWIRTLCINNLVGLFALKQYKLSGAVLFCLLLRWVFVCGNFWNEIFRSLCGAHEYQPDAY